MNGGGELRRVLGSRVDLRVLGSRADLRVLGSRADPARRSQSRRTVIVVHAPTCTWSPSWSGTGT